MSDQQPNIPWEAIEAKLSAGHKIEAIKLFRAAANCGLKEAKDAIDRHEAELRRQFPDRFAARTGCLGAIAVAGLGTGMLAWFAIA